MKKSIIRDDNLFTIFHKINLLKYFFQLPWWCCAIFFTVNTSDNYAFLNLPWKWGAAGSLARLPNEDPGTKPVVDKSCQDAD